MRVAASGRATGGFTLVEMVISAALMAVILGAAYACLRAGFETRRIIEPRGDALQNGRVALDLLGADLRCACALHKGSEFLGMKRQLEAMDADNVDLATHHFTPRRPGEGDYCTVSWYVEPDAQSGAARLWRRRNPALSQDPISGGTREEIAAGVRAFTLEYYDGFEWYDSWGDPQGAAKKESSFKERPNLTGLPEAVRATLVLDAEPAAKAAAGAGEPAPRITFQTVVRLNLAAAAGGASGTTPGTGRN